jgi:dihydrofolate synthase/folylpolyglutamate synthase
MIREEIQYLFDRGMFGMKMGLKNILDLLEYCKVDHKKLVTVHVAGTNGKGSTSNIISQVLTANGYKTGLFTSPHLQRFNERIRIDNIEISDEELSEYIKFFKSGIEKFNCTFFEANTAIAFKYFLDKKVDIAVIETGLGGRLDATNIITPVVSVITGIDFDHQKQLGNSIVQIAREKAGIFKPGVQAVANFRREAVRKVFRSYAKKNKSELNLVKKKEFKFINSAGERIFEFFMDGVKHRAVINLKGKYQEDNLRTAVTALKIMSNRFKLDPAKTVTALSGIKVKGRMEVISKEPLFIIDAAHNIEGLTFLKCELENSVRGTIHLILGMVKDKDYEKALKFISGIKAKKYFTQAENKRMLDIETMKKDKYLNNDRTASYFIKPYEAYAEAVKNYRKGDIIVAAGSHFILGDLLDQLNSKK